MNFIELRHCYYRDNRLISKNVCKFITHINLFHKQMHFKDTLEIWPKRLKSYTFLCNFGHWVILHRFHQNKLARIVAFKFAPKLSVKKQ